MRFFSKLIIILIANLISNSVFSQGALDSVSFTTEGEIKVELLYDQYFQEKNWSDTLLSPWGYQLRESYHPVELFFVFGCPECYKDYERNILYFDSNKIRIKRLVHKDSIRCCVKIPLLETSVQRRFQEIKSYNWDLTTEIVDDGCQDTHYSNLQISNKKGTVRFKNLNNVCVYELGWLNETSTLLVVSARLCRNEIIIYQIE